MIGRRVEADAERVSPPSEVLLQKPSSSWEVVSEKAIPYARPSIPHRHHYPHLIHSGWCGSRGRAVKSPYMSSAPLPAPFPEGARYVEHTKRGLPRPGQELIGLSCTAKEKGPETGCPSP